MMSYKNYFRIGLLLVILILIAVVVSIVLTVGNQIKVSVVTDKGGYVLGEALKVKIVNSAKDTICFSACYPYEFERKVNAWQKYSYPSCDKPDVAEWCIESGKTKAFEIALDSVREGIHRLAIPACLNCNLGGVFQQDLKLYSNNFDIEK